MGIEVTQLQDWIGSEAQTASGEKLGKIEDVYFAGADPVALSIRSGLAGRKHHAASLCGASVTRDAVHLAVDADLLISTSGGPLTGSEISALAGQDERLRGVAPEDVQSWHEREESRKEAEAARANADKLEAEAARRAEAEQQAALTADDADIAAEDAIREREAAEQRAIEARIAAEQTERAHGG